MFRPFSLLAFLFAVSAFALNTQTAHAGWFGYSTFEECLLGEMKGQDSSMKYTAEQKCKTDFHMPLSVASEMFSPEWRGPIVVAKETDKFRPYQVSAFMYAKECKDVKRFEDKAVKVELNFDLFGTALVPDYANFKCMIFGLFWATPK